jgi:hypothetical protein
MCPIYTHDGASAKFSTNSQETNNSVPLSFNKVKFMYKGTLLRDPGWIQGVQGPQDRGWGGQVIRHQVNH